MKNYLKSQAKKSMSLFLAVLMVLSCWVWMAPAEVLDAKAGTDDSNITPSDKYTIKVKYNVTDKYGKDDGKVEFKFWYKENNGTGNVVGPTTVNGPLNKAGWQEITQTFSGIPFYIECATYRGTNSSTSDDIQYGVSWDYVEISNGNGVSTGDAFNDTYSFAHATLANWSDAKAWLISGFDAPNSADATYTEQAITAPFVVGFDTSTVNDDEIEINLSKITGYKDGKPVGDDKSGAATFTLGTLYDQYGVKWTSSSYKFSDSTSKSTYIAEQEAGEPISTEKGSDYLTVAASLSNTSATGTVTANPGLQTAVAKSANGVANYYLVHKWETSYNGGTITARTATKIKINYPKYTVLFDGGLGEAATITVGSKTYDGTYSASNFHGGNIDLPSGATASGYSFYGFWSKEQPSEGNANYNAKKKDFAAPCSTEDFNNIPGEATNGIKVDENGKKWYDAGRRLDTTADKTILVDEESFPNFVDKWYGWWLSEDVTVKFYDVDGQFLGEKAVKSGLNQSSIEWPTSKYTSYTNGAVTFTVDPYFWVNSDGSKIDKRSYTFTKDLILTPALTDKEFTSKYNVTFMMPNGDKVSKDYDYRANVSADANTNYAKLPVTPPSNSLSSEEKLEFSYELIGWSGVAPTTGKNYHVLLEDADFDVNGTLISLNKDWVVRDTATYYPVYRRYTKTYVVEFNYKDATGADTSRQVKVKYRGTLAAPTDYVPYRYVTKGFGYTFANWMYTDAEGDATFGYDTTIPFTSANISIEGAALDDGVDVTPIQITAAYGTPEATPYTVTFNYYDANGNTITVSEEVVNEQFITQDTVNALSPATEWENEDQLYTYADKWVITNGAATVGINGAVKTVDAVIDTEDLISLTPTSDITFQAVYADPIPYYTVTYVDGAKTYSERVLCDSGMPAWMDGDEVYVPADYEGEGGTYVFQGWFDAVTGGNKIETAKATVTSNITLYSQFKFEPFTYTIKFMNHDGSVQLGIGEYEKGQNIEALVVTATKAAQGRAADDTYTYVFLGWDKAVPSFCEGYNVTFTALYKPVYKYYDAKWYNSSLDADGNWVANKATATDDAGNEVETYLLATTHHTYDSKLYTPSIDNLTCLETAPDGQTYVFAGWYYNDAEGNAVKYERGMRITAEMEFYATYTLTAKTYTVTTVVKGDETKYTVADGDTASISDPQAGYVNAEKHDEFVGWYADAAYTTEFDLDAEITADTKIYAKFEESNHDFTSKELVTAPTYYAEGAMDVWCDCDKTKTKKSESIDMLTDNVAPTGTIYLGSLGKWSSTDAIGGAALDYDNEGNKLPVALFANAETDVIIAANDAGDVNALYNAAGTGIGVKRIRAFVYPAKYSLTADTYYAAQQVAVDVYVDETEALTNNANFSIKLGDIVVADLTEDGKAQYEDGNVKYKALESGEEYILYYYVIDKAGNQLNSKVRTAAFVYDNTNPEFTVVGETNGAATPTYCGVATVTGIEKDVVLTVNGETVAVDYAEGAETGTYEIAYAEGMYNVLITATDKAGNSYSKKIKIADHSYFTTESAASCGVAGYKKTECLICGDVAVNETYDALDHIWSDRQVIPADCVNNGTIIVTCSICGDKVVTVFEEDGVTPVIPALGHEYAKNDEGEIIYTTATESTCCTKGEAEAYCAICGEGRITTELALNPKNHEEITATYADATCTENGYYTERCKCNTVIVHKDHETDPEIYAAGHGTLEDGTAYWAITEPTCYQDGAKVLKCLKCQENIKVDGEDVIEVLEATGEHVKVVANPDTYKEEHRVEYKCATEGCTFEYEDKILVDEIPEEYTVKFVAEDGETELGKVVVVEGNLLTQAPAAPTKDATVEYSYTFAGWANGDKVIKLPYEVTEDITLKATFKETKIKYTHIFRVPTSYTETLAAEANTALYATLVGTYGDVRVPSGTPVLSLTGDEAKLYKVEFKGWMNKDGEIVTDFTVVGNAEFTAYFEAVAIEYKVTFYNGTGNFVWSTTVDAGESVSFGGTTPTKASDGDCHYEFNGWYTDEAATKAYNDAAITADTRLYAGFTAIAHDEFYVVNTEAGVNGVTQAQTCVLPELTEYICSECGHTKAVETKAARGHKMSEYTYDEETGKMVSKCENCDVTDSYKASVTINFVNENGISLQLSTVQMSANGTVEYTGKLPEKNADNENTYVFAGWKDEEGNVVSNVLGVKVPADKDATYTAFFTAVPRTFVVRYVDNNNGYAVVYYFKDADGNEITFKYGDAVPAAPAGLEAQLVVPGFEQHGHKVFDCWNISADATVTGDMYITPKFKTVEHECIEIGKTGATCTEKGGVEYKCTGCEYKYVDTDANLPALGHVWDAGTVTLEPNYATQTDGERTYKCTREGCDATKTEAISGKSRSIKVTVKDDNGAAIEHATVRLLKDGEIVRVQTTDNKGVTIFAGLDNGNYSVYVVDTNTSYSDIVVNEDGSVKNGDLIATPEKEEIDTSCKCTCHKNTFWGMIFRLFQKIIKLFTGKASCCACPSDAI
ncbi:MAG: InlB B-repeat-containing protein [Clostridia bacterium]|nr:InlB B-repeat-containing protein [Clostridia bacterium]